jgi:hypothetical protein
MIVTLIVAVAISAPSKHLITVVAVLWSARTADRSGIVIVVVIVVVAHFLLLWSCMNSDLAPRFSLASERICAVGRVHLNQ